MKTFTRICAQGDVLIRRVGAIPNVPVNSVAPENGHLIITHSETGHHHVMEGDRVEMVTLADDALRSFLTVHETATLTHLRDHDTHEAIQFYPGVYEVRRQREYTPEGYRRAQD